VAQVDAGSQKDLASLRAAIIGCRCKGDLDEFPERERDDEGLRLCPVRLTDLGRIDALQPDEQDFMPTQYLDGVPLAHRDNMALERFGSDTKSTAQKENAELQDGQR
jgi:hypothetical protein